LNRACCTLLWPPSPCRTCRRGTYRRRTWPRDGGTCRRRTWPRDGGTCHHRNFPGAIRMDNRKLGRKGCRTMCYMDCRTNCRMDCRSIRKPKPLKMTKQIVILNSEFKYF